VKTDASGNHQWNQTYGGTNIDLGLSVLQTSDSGYILLGYTSSFGAGLEDFWLVKTDASGNHQWNQTYGGTDYDHGFSVQQTSDNGYILLGGTTSFGAGDFDFWLVKVGGKEADLVGRSAWPEHHHFVKSKDGNITIADKHGTPGNQTLYGKVKNTGNENLTAGTYKVIWKIVDSEGMSVGSYETVGTVALAPGDITILTYDLDVSTFDGKYYVTARCWYYDLAGEKLKSFSFSVVP